MDVDFLDIIDYEIEMRFITWFALFLFLFHSPVFETKADSYSSWPSIKKLTDGKFDFDGVTINQKLREIEFVAVSNQNYGLIEYGIVHETGKIHESLFRTEIRPQIIHASMLLLKHEPHQAFFEDLQEGQFNENRYLLNAVEVFISWENNGTRIEKNLREFYFNQQRESIAEKSGVFLFTGSRMIEKTFMAEHTGSILAVYLDQDALYNSTEYDSNNDDVWVAKKPVMPPLEKVVTCVFRLPKKVH
tara:strand:+ start:498 stop:1235 length:738 start_codon:yes stop_codon:yes gene_type:complete